MTAIIDYDTGNLRSVCNALGRIGAEYIITSDPKVIRSARRVLLPGVGEASSAMEKLRVRGLCEVLTTLTQPVLGICIGMQLMCRGSEEGDARCLGIFDTDVRRLMPCKEEGIKVPHMGWNRVEEISSPLFKGVDNGAFVYFVHSFAPDLCNETIASSQHGRKFSSALQKRNFYGTQFHPEKSGIVGDIILHNFMEL